MHFWIVGLSTPSVPMLCLKDPLMEDDTIYLELLLIARMVCWKKLPGCCQLKDKKTSSLAITTLYWNAMVYISNIYIYTYIYIYIYILYILLSHHCVYIYIYIYMEIVAFVLFERQTNGVSGWCSLSMLLNFFGDEGFCWRDFSFWGDFFSYFLAFSFDIGYLLSSNLKNTYFHRRYLWEQTFLIGKPITDRFLFFNYFLTCQPIKYTDLHQWEEYPFQVPDFNWSSNQITIEKLGKLRVPVYTLWKSISFHIN